MKLDPSKVNQESVSRIAGMLKALPEDAAKRNAEIVAGYRAEFEQLNPSYQFERHKNGTYKNTYVESDWKGWLNCMQKRKPTIKFMGAEIRLPADELKRAHVVEELGVVFACYITQLLETWPKDHGRMDSVFRNIERMCISAYSVLEEEEFRDFSSRLIDKDFIAKKRF